METTSGTKHIKDVLFVPNISQNLLNVGQMIHSGFKVIFEEKQCLIKDANDDGVFRVKIKGKSFAFDPLKEEQTAFPATKTNAEVRHTSITQLW